MISITGNNIILTKAIVMVSLGASSFLCGVFPLLLSYIFERKTHRQETAEEKSRAQRSKQRVISLMMSFTGGVLFCTVFIHLLPEVSEVFANLRQEGEYQELPPFFPQALLCVGFFIMYFVEEVAHKLMHSDIKAMLPSERPENEIQIMSINALPSTLDENRIAVSYKHAVFFNNVINVTEEASKDLSPEDRYDIMNLVKKALTSGDIDSRDQQIDASLITDKCRKDEAVHEMELLNKTGSSIRSFLLALALSVHALFEGMAIGLESKPSAVWLMLLGVGSHKMVLSVCMGVEMVAGNIGTVTHILYVTMFAVVSPIGIGAGLLVSSEEDVAAAIFQGIASGTLLYVLFFEVLERSGSESNGTTGFLSFIVVILGFGVMLTLQIMADS